MTNYDAQPEGQFMSTPDAPNPTAGEIVPDFSSAEIEATQLHPEAERPLIERIEKSADRFEKVIGNIKLESLASSDMSELQEGRLSQFLAGIQRLEEGLAKHDGDLDAYGQYLVNSWGDKHRQGAIRKMRGTRVSTEDREYEYDKQQSIGENIAVQHLGRLAWYQREGNKQLLNEMYELFTEQSLAHRQQQYLEREAAKKAA